MKFNTPDPPPIHPSLVWPDKLTSQISRYFQEDSVIVVSPPVGERAQWTYPFRHVHVRALVPSLSLEVHWDVTRGVYKIENAFDRRVAHIAAFWKKNLSYKYCERSARKTGSLTVIVWEWQHPGRLKASWKTRTVPQTSSLCPTTYSQRTSIKPRHFRRMTNSKLSRSACRDIVKQRTLAS